MTPVCCVFGRPVPHEDSLDALKNLQNHITGALGAEVLDRWTAEVTYKIKQKQSKGTVSEMKFGVNVAAAFVGMKRDDGSSYPYGKQYCIRRSDMEGRLMIVQEVAEGQPKLSGEGCLDHILEGGRELEASPAMRAPLTTRLKAIVDGQAYCLGDLVIRAGSFRKGATYRGLVLEVEYQPCNNIEDGLNFIEAFFPSVAYGADFAIASNLRDKSVFGNSGEYSAKHTAVQMTDLFNGVFT
ncbi:unnamed protein product [Discosporangium mesarthrocarpum]